MKYFNKKINWMSNKKQTIFELVSIIIVTLFWFFFAYNPGEMSRENSQEITTSLLFSVATALTIILSIRFALDYSNKETGSGLTSSLSNKALTNNRKKGYMFLILGLFLFWVAFTFLWN